MQNFSSAGLSVHTFSPITFEVLVHRDTAATYTGGLAVPSPRLFAAAAGSNAAQLPSSSPAAASPPPAAVLGSLRFAQDLFDDLLQAHAPRGLCVRCLSDQPALRRYPPSVLALLTTHGAAHTHAIPPAHGITYEAVPVEIEPSSPSTASAGGAFLSLTVRLLDSRLASHVRAVLHRHPFISLTHGRLLSPTANVGAAADEAPPNPAQYNLDDDLFEKLKKPIGAAAGAEDRRRCAADALIGTKTARTADATEAADRDGNGSSEWAGIEDQERRLTSGELTRFDLKSPFYDSISTPAALLRWITVHVDFVGALGKTGDDASPFAYAVWKLLKLQVPAAVLLRRFAGSVNRYVRAVAMFASRFVMPVEEILPVLAPSLEDCEEVATTPDHTETLSMQSLCETLLFEDDVCEFFLPRFDPALLGGLRARIASYRRDMEEQRKLLAELAEAERMRQAAKKAAAKQKEEDAQAGGAPSTTASSSSRGGGGGVGAALGFSSIAKLREFALRQERLKAQAGMKMLDDEDDHFDVASSSDSDDGDNDDPNSSGGGGGKGGRRGGGHVNALIGSGKYIAPTHMEDAAHFGSTSSAAAANSSSGAATHDHKVKRKSTHQQGMSGDRGGDGEDGSGGAHDAHQQALREYRLKVRQAVLAVSYDAGFNAQTNRVLWALCGRTEAPRADNEMYLDF